MASTALVLKQANAIARAKAGGRKRRRHSRPKFTLPVAVVAGFVPLAVGTWNRRSSATAMSQYLSGALTGYVPGQGWNPALLKDGALPIILGIMAHKVAGRLGLNRAIARAGVPFIRI